MVAGNLSCGSTGLCEGRHVRALAVVAALARQLRRGRLDARAEHARAETDFLLRHGQPEMRVGQHLANPAVICTCLCDLRHRFLSADRPHYRKSYLRETSV